MDTSAFTILRRLVLDDLLKLVIAVRDRKNARCWILLRNALAKLAWDMLLFRPDRDWQMCNYLATFQRMTFSSLPGFSILILVPSASINPSSLKSESTRITDSAAVPTILARSSLVIAMTDLSSFN